MANTKRAFPYAKISTFGQVAPILMTDPVGYSVSKNIDTDFDIGPTSRLFGPEQPNAQLYMAEKCAKEWDGACEFMSRNRTGAGNVCNAGKIPSELFPTPPTSDMGIGDFLIENAAVRRFCDLSSCQVSQEPYNPMDPHSPMVKSYSDCCAAKCMPVCKPPSNINDVKNDILLNKVLDHPDRHVDLLLNMYKNTPQNERGKYENTRIGMIFTVFDAYFKKNQKSS